MALKKAHLLPCAATSSEALILRIQPQEKLLISGLEPILE